MKDFKYGRSMTRAGYTWYCQVPGGLWATDPVIGWKLIHKDDDWYLAVGNAPPESLGTPRLMVAMDRAANRSGHPVITKAFKSVEISRVDHESDGRMGPVILHATCPECSFDPGDLLNTTCPRCGHRMLIPKGTPAVKSLDDRIMEAAETLPEDQANDLKSYAAHIRETWRGADHYDSLAEALEVIADAAAEAAKMLRDRE